MSDLPAVAGTAIVQPTPQPYEKLKRDGGKESRPRRERTSKTTELEISQPVAHTLNVSA
ncbi:MAG TPA: hypothetical protein VKT26_05460 [Acetobacteraceae bacterium]|nr:hypothetical protein [Acetobacteraceae bacterium]